MRLSLFIPELRRRSRPFAIFVIVGLVWEAATWADLLDRRYLPSAHEVIRASAQLFGQSGFVESLWSTLSNCAVGLLIAAAVGILASVLISRFSALRSLALPVIEFLRPMPSIAIIPFAVLVLGLGTRMRVAVVAYGAVWPILISTMYGVRHVDKEILEVAKTFKLGPRATLVKIILPASLPYILTGLRTACGIALLLAVSVEMVAGGDGVGNFLLEMQFASNLPSMYAAIIFVGCLGYLLNEGFLILQNKRLAANTRPDSKA